MAYPSENRKQLWPLCCGASIISGFKTPVSLEQFEATLKSIPVTESQVYTGEKRNPELTFICLNDTQEASKTITDMLRECGFIKFMSSRNTTYGAGPDNLFFYMRSSMPINLYVKESVLEPYTKESSKLG